MYIIRNKVTIAFVSLQKSFQVFLISHFCEVTFKLLVTFYSLFTQKRKTSLFEEMAC